MSLILVSCNNMYNDFSKENEVSFNFKIDLKNYGGNYNYVEATVYDASKIKFDGEYKYSNIDFSSLPNGYSSKHEIGVGEQVSFEILNVPKNLRAIVVVELLNIENRVTTVVYGGISDIFTVSKNAKYSLNLEKMTQTSVGLTGENVIYKVEHYQQNLKDENYTLIETEYKEGLNSNKATDSPREYQGFYTKDVQLSNEGTAVKVYYDRNTFTVNLNTDEGILENTELTVKYGERLDNNLKPTKEGYYFIGWYQDEEFATTFDFSTKIDKDYVLFAKWIDVAESSCTSNDVSTFIKNLTGEGPHYVKVTGAITDSTIENIRKAMKNNPNALISLDLSETTGLTKLSREREYNDSPFVRDYYCQYSCNGCSYCTINDFYGCSSLYSIKLPNSITSIDTKAFFYCDNLYKIEMGDNLKSIGAKAFYGCHNLTEIYFSNNITSIGSETFVDCASLETILLPTSISGIGTYAFKNCINLETINLPESVTKISDELFSNCSSLKFVDILGNITSIGTSAFKNCSSLENLILPDSVKTISDEAFSNCTELKFIELPESISTLSSTAFIGCSNLKEIKIPEGVTTLDIQLDMTSLERIYIPSTVTSIPSSFYNVNRPKLTEIIVSPENTVYKSISGIVIKNSDLSIVMGVNSSNIVIPEEIQSIGSYAFSNCDGLESIKIGDNVQSIGSYAFSNCYSLESIKIGDNVQSIGSYAFNNCSNLQSVEIGNNVQSINSGTFSGCSNLEKVILSDSLKSIGKDAFNECYSLKTVDGSIDGWYQNRAYSKYYNTGNGGTYTNYKNFDIIPTANMLVFGYYNEYDSKYYYGFERD